VRKYDAVPPYAETQAYVKNVTALYEQYKAP
jgi:soluble lytic murein transglycosylase-like protein